MLKKDKSDSRNLDTGTPLCIKVNIINFSKEIIFLNYCTQKY